MQVNVHESAMFYTIRTTQRYPAHGKTYLITHLDATEKYNKTLPGIWNILFMAPRIKLIEIFLTYFGASLSKRMRRFDLRDQDL